MEVRQIVEENSRPLDPVIYTDGSVVRGVRSGWGFVVYKDGRIIKKSSGACSRTTLSTRMEIEAVTKAFEWLKENLPSARHAVIVTDSQNVLQRVNKWTLRKEWLQSIGECRLRRLTWIYAPSHTGVVGNEQADKLASNAPVNTDIKMDKNDVVKALATALEDEEIEHDSVPIFRLEEMGVFRGSGRTSMMQGMERRVINQMNTGTISRRTLGWILERGAEHVWRCPECYDVVPGIK